MSVSGVLLNTGITVSQLPQRYHCKWKPNVKRIYFSYPKSIIFLTVTTNVCNLNTRSLYMVRWIYKIKPNNMPFHYEKFRMGRLALGYYRQYIQGPIDHKEV